MRTGRPRVRHVATWGLLVLVLAVLAGPHGSPGGGPNGLGRVTLTTARIAVLPSVAPSTPHLVQADPAWSAALPLGTLSALLLLVVASGWLERGRASLPMRRGLLRALRPGRSPPVEARSQASTGL
jgi:hypothetical protein